MFFLPTQHEDAIGSVSTEWGQNHLGTLINKGRESHQLLPVEYLSFLTYFLFQGYITLLESLLKK